MSTHFILLVCLLKGFLGHKSQMNIRSFLEVDALKAIKVAQVCSARNHSVIVSKSCNNNNNTQREREHGTHQRREQSRTSIESIVTMRQLYLKGLLYCCSHVRAGVLLWIPQIWLSRTHPSCLFSVFNYNYSCPHVMQHYRTPWAWR